MAHSGMRLAGEGLELLDCAGMRAADAAAMDFGVAGRALMEKAGAAVADVACELSGGRGGVLVLAGPGNNGGDGFVAARLLKERGVAVDVALLGVRERLQGDAAWAAGEWDGEVLPAESFAEAGENAFDGYDLVIDALFGAGLDRPLKGAAAALAALAVATRGRGEIRVLAVDVPSGLNGDTGRPMGGGPCFEADATVTFFRKKPGHLLYPGRDLCGELRVADIGIPERVWRDIAPVAFENDVRLFRAALPAFTRDMHKYRRGSLMVLSGDALHTGASRLAALAGLRAGAGAVTLAGDREALTIQAGQVTEVMLQPVDDARRLVEALALKHAHAMLIGPAAGVNGMVRDMTLAVLGHAPQVAVVLDADVFTIFREDPQTLFAAIAGRRGPVVLTPHEGEFARLFPDLARDREDHSGKLGRVKEAARRAGCVVLLKGADTVIADAEGNAVIDSDSPPWLATAGSGDVLAGAIAALLARRMPPLAAAAAGARLHALAAWRAGPGLVAGDLPVRIGEVLTEITGAAERWKDLRP